MSVEVVTLTAQDLIWPFEQQNGPYLLIGGGRYPSQTRVDPFPCYSHDLALVEQEVAFVTSLWTVPFDVRFYVLAHETESRTNGWARIDCSEYGDDHKEKAWVASIALLGKRIPIHPAMTRYLVTHEYGHVVEDAISLQRGETVHSSAVLDEYQTVRNLAKAPSYGGATWHLNACELFANDFRVLVAGSEVEFWPHPGIPRPEDVPGLREWWGRQVSLHAAEWVAKPRDEILRHVYKGDPAVAIA